MQTASHALACIDVGEAETLELGLERLDVERHLQRLQRKRTRDIEEKTMVNEVHEVFLDVQRMTEMLQTVLRKETNRP